MNTETPATEMPVTIPPSVHTAGQGPLSLLDIERVINETLELTTYIDAETGEVFEKDDAGFDERITSMLNDLAAIEKEKVDRIVLAMRKRECDIAYYRDEERRLATKRRSLEARYERFCDFITSIIEATGKRKIDGITRSLSIRFSESVVIDDGVDMQNMPDRHVRVEKELDKTTIKAVLKAGGDVPHASIKLNPYLVIG